jgi:uncharacterized membrane protein YqjE
MDVMTDPLGTGSSALPDDRPTVQHGYTDPGYTDTGRPDVEGRSVGDLIGEVTSDLSKLMRQELDLAKVEMKAEASKAGKAAGMLGGAGVAANLMLVFVSLALMFALDQIMPIGWAALIVGVLWGIVAAVLAARGRKQLKEVNPKPERTVETLKEDAQWAKTRSS